MFHGQRLKLYSLHKKKTFTQTKQNMLKRRFDNSNYELERPLARGKYK